MDLRQETTVPPSVALRIAEQQYDSPFIGESLDLVMDALPSGLIYIDAALRIQHCNRRCAGWLGERAPTLRGRHAATAFGAQPWRHFEPHLRRALNGEQSTHEHILATPDRGDLRFETTCIPDRDAEGKVRGIFALLSEIAVRSPAESIALHVAQHADPAGVHGPQGLADRIREALVARRRDGQRMALLWLGLEGIRPADAEYGQPPCDGLVPDIANRIASCVRKSDFVAQIGAEELAVLLPSLAESGDAAYVARKIQTVCERTVDIGGSHLRPHASIGVAVFPDQATDAAGILAAAEADLARARCAEPAAILT